MGWGRFQKNLTTRKLVSRVIPTVVTCRITTTTVGNTGDHVVALEPYLFSRASRRPFQLGLTAGV